MTGSYHLTSTAGLAVDVAGRIDAAAMANHQLPEQAEQFGTGPEFTPASSSEPTAATTSNTPTTRSANS